MLVLMLMSHSSKDLFVLSFVLPCAYAYVVSENQALENNFIVILSPFGALHCLWADTRMFLFSSILVFWAARLSIMQSWSYYWP